MGQKLTKQDVRDAVQHAFEQTKAVTGGKKTPTIYPIWPTYRPTCSASPSVCPTERLSPQATRNYKFGIESVSKVPTAILAMNQYSAEEVLAKIGADATGLPFNSIMAILLEKDHPSTPLVNAGAIAAACSMIKPIRKPDAKWEAIRDSSKDSAARAWRSSTNFTKSETATNFNNKSIAWLLKKLFAHLRRSRYGARPLHPPVFDRRNGPPTGGRGCDHRIRRREPRNQTDGLQARSGYAHRLDDGHRRFYEHTGDWLFNTGLPAKTGVGGGIMGVVPGVMGVAAFAPRWMTPATRSRPRLPWATSSDSSTSSSIRVKASWQNRHRRIVPE